MDSNHEILVYNLTFIHENFFESENLKGIFTLSKENKEAEIKIANAKKEISKFENDKKIKSQELEENKNSLDRKQGTAKNVVWKIKTDYSGGDRVLEFCLDGYKGSKDTLFNHIVSLVKPVAKPIKSINDLKYDLQSITGDNAKKYSELPLITFTSQKLETEILFSKQIVGNENSTISQLIKEFGNSDWVKDGLRYLPSEPIKENEVCPFCQAKTISNALVENIKNYFDDSYGADIILLKSFLEKYSQAIQSIPSKSFYEANPKFEPHKKDFEIKYNAFTKIIQDNKKLIEDKIKTPSVSVVLQISINALEELNDIIQKINTLVTEHNNNIDQKETVKTNIKKTFWEIMRWEYDQTVSSFISNKAISNIKTDALTVSINYCETKIADLNTIISEQQNQ